MMIIVMMQVKNGRGPCSLALAWLPQQLPLSGVLRYTTSDRDAGPTFDGNLSADYLQH